MNDQSFGISLISSLLLHGLALVIAATFLRYGNLDKQDLFRVQLVDHRSLSEKPAAPEKKLSTIAEAETSKETRSALKNESSRVAAPMAPTAKDDNVQSVEGKTDASTSLSTVRAEGGGSEAAADKLFAKGDVGRAPGTASAGGGTAVAGPGRGAGAPGLPSQPTILKTNRAAKALQTARASYPAMALRAGLESDVTLRIEVDAQGNVTKAEVVKSGGAGFDDEALKAVKQSRFEPAQKDGQNIPAEFTYIYRFRLQR